MKVVYSVQHSVNVFPAFVLAVVFVHVEKFIYGNITAMKLHFVMD